MAKLSLKEAQSQYTNRNGTIEHVISIPFNTLVELDGIDELNDFLCDECDGFLPSDITYHPLGINADGDIVVACHYTLEGDYVPEQ